MSIRAHSTQLVEHLSGGICPVCDERSPEPFFVLRQVPVLSCVLHASDAAARSTARGDVELVVCPKCALIYNRAFNPALIEYAPGYENSLHGSSSFRVFANELAQRLVTTDQLHGGVAIEIGCGDGYFLDVLLKHGMREAVGYDPSAKRRSVKVSAGRLMRIVPERFDKPKLGERIDAIICRHVFEHLPNPDEFLRSLRETVGCRNPLVYFEVPNTEWLLNSISVWDVIYEHITYWTRASLSSLFVRSGFTPSSVSTGFGDQFLMLEGRPSSSPLLQHWPSRSEVLRITRLCEHFGRVSAMLILRWQTALRKLKARRRTTVLWGAGSKGVTFANLVAADEGLVAGIVDVNPRKHRMSVSGCGLPILAPEDLKKVRPDVVVLMNTNYAAEMSAQLNELGLSAEIRHAGDTQCLPNAACA
jgi:SAM-dependent methyltransferase